MGGGGGGCGEGAGLGARWSRGYEGGNPIRC